MCKHLHVMGAAATPQPGYAIYYVECIVFTSLLHHNQATSYYKTITISHQEEKRDFLLFPIEISYGTISSARAHSSVVRAVPS